MNYKKLFKLRYQYFFIIVFIINLLIIFLSKNTNEIDLHCSIIETSATSQEIIDSNSTCDTSSNLRAAQDFLKLELSPTTMKTLNNWPIGMPLLFLPLLILEQIGIPLILSFAVFMSLLISYFLTICFKLSIRLNRPLLGYVFAIIFLFTSPNEGWISGSGLLYPEGIAITLWLIALVKVFTIEKLNSNPKLKSILFISLCLALASYFRAIFEFQINLLLAITTFLIILSLNKSFISKKMLTIFNTPLLKKVFVVLLFTSLFMIPWRLVAEKIVHPGNYGWTSSYNKWWITWIPTERLSEFNISFDSAQGGINLACQLDPTRCSKFNIPVSFMEEGNMARNDSKYLSAYLNSIFENPRAYLKTKLLIFKDYWLQDNQFNYLRNWNFSEGYFYAGILVLSSLFGIFQIRKISFTSLIVYTSVFSQCFVLLLHHVEARYFIGIKLISLSYLFLLLMCVPNLGFSKRLVARR